MVREAKGLARARKVSFSSMVEQALVREVAEQGNSNSPVNELEQLVSQLKNAVAALHAKKRNG